MCRPNKNKNWSDSSYFPNYTVNKVNRISPGKIYLTFFLVSIFGGLVIAGLSVNNNINVTNHTIGYNSNYIDGYRTLGGESFVETLPEPNLTISQGGWVGPFDTQQGYIQIIQSNVVFDTLPLCITNEFLDEWEIVVEVFGGYEPVKTFIPVYQKGVHVGTIWTTAEELDWETPCCAYSYYLFTFFVEESICLDSNQYPPVCDGFGIYEATEHPEECVPIPYDTIPGKEVWGYLHSEWTGCGCVDQHFVIILLEVKWVH